MGEKKVSNVECRQKTTQPQSMENTSLWRWQGQKGNNTKI